VIRRIAIFRAVAREVRRMHDAGIYTRDLQETNIFVGEAPAGGFRVSFLDLEDFRRIRRVTDRRRWTNLVHLDRSVGRFMSRAARLDFLYAYLGGRPQREDARRIVREIVALKIAVGARRTSTGSGANAAESDASKIPA
jgi:tRNA A-37 threonylcarbamoyl transferase component Bud32